MAKASNVAVAHSNIIPQPAVGRDCTWLTEWTNPGLGNYLGKIRLSNNPPALLLGERYSIPVGSLVKVQAGYRLGPTLPVGPVAGQIFQFSTAAVNLSGTYHVNGRNTLTTAIANDVFIWNGNRWIKQGEQEKEILSYETELQAMRSLYGRIAGGIWYQCHDGDPGTMGIENIIPNIHRLGISEDSWRIEAT